MPFRLRLFVAEEYKPLRQMSPFMWLLTLGAFCLQILFTLYLLPPPEVRQQDYTPPPPTALLRLAAFGEPETLAKILVLRLQSFDNQPGVSIPFAELNYDYLGEWLDAVVALDEHAEYPHFLMAKVYSSVKNTERGYIAANWVWQHFKNNPDERWWWMAHIVGFVRHKLKDNTLALAMAHDLRTLLTPGKTPSWPRQMEVYILENQSEFDEAAAILFNQLEAGEITDPQEFVFLLERLEQLTENMAREGKIVNQQEWEDKLDILKQLQTQYLQQFDEEENNDTTASLPA